MDMILILIWFMTAVGYLLSLIVSAYYVSVRGAKTLDVFAKVFVGAIVFGLFTVPIGWVAAIIVFIGAHTVPPGSVLGPRELAIGALILAIYVASEWLVCSFIVGRLILPRFFSRADATF